MNSFDPGALRQVMESLQFEGANDLVQRTLAQHGLAMPVLPTGGPAASPAAEPLPTGARFQAGRFTDPAGARDHLTYVPASAAQGAQGLVLMLHGCTQTHADFARGTGMNALAEQHRLIVVYPQQARGDNAQSCWNWFSRGDQRRGRGEPEILAQLALDAARAHGVPQDRIFVAGLSAGAAMAVILGQTHPEVFAAVGAHSGLPFGAAKDVTSAFAAMSGGPAPDGTPRPDPAPTPTIVFHGSADRTVNPVNGERIAADTLAAGPEQTLFDRSAGRAGSRSFTREVTRTPEGGRLLENWRVEGLGHAWSGGDPAGSYTDPQGPAASAEMVRFFLDLPKTRD